MVSKSHAKRRRDIKTKLMAAIAMLLVSSIMMVSSTYAWFTLSTAPEVTGINTAVGANGNLEMALLPASGLVSDITSKAGDGVLAIKERNVTWGNLVDLSDTSVYGLDKVVLLPSELNLTEEGKVAVDGYVVKTPKYGADGRVAELLANGETGTYNTLNGNFAPDEFKGVRAIGAASGMTPRQLSYRNARSAANTAKSMAANLASGSLNNNGSRLANIAVQYGMNGATATFTGTDIAALRDIVDDLKDKVLPQLETAYMQYILAYAASNANSLGDDAWKAVETAVNTPGVTLNNITAAFSAAQLTLPDAITDGITAYNVSKADVADADSKLQALEARLEDDTTENDTFNWTEVSAVLTTLADPTQMKLNGYTMGEVKEKLGEIVSSITAQGGLKVVMETGAGVYADIADQSGDYTASVNIEEVAYNGITLNNMSAKMETESTVEPPYLDAVGTAVATAGAPQSATGTTLPISDTYGYIIDLAFRTNAVDSKLILQKEASDRIYGDNTNEETMGHGATMTFMATTTDFSNDQVKGLMDAINIVFFNPADGAIYSYARLDTVNATSGTDGWTAEIVLYNIAEGATTYTPATYAENSNLTYYTKSTQDVYTQLTDEQAAAVTDSNLYVEDVDNQGKYVAVAYEANSGKTYYSKSTKDVYTAVDKATAAGATAGTLYTASKAADTTEDSTDNVILSLTQNQATAVSVLVYLDGNKVTNANVAATGSTSMTGKMNLQFASSANLVPMEYADLHLQGSKTVMSAVTSTTADVTEASFLGKKISFKLDEKGEVTTAIATGTVKVTVDGKEYDATYANGVWSATVTSEVKADTAVTVTYTAPTAG